MKSAQYIQTMCDYDRWMNQRLFAVCATIPDDIRKEDKGAFFQSMHGTLNHLLLADKIWLGRFWAQPFAVRSLDQELHSDFCALRQDREKTDDAIEEWARAQRRDAFVHRDVPERHLGTGIYPDAVAVRHSLLQSSDPPLRPPDNPVQPGGL